MTDIKDDEHNICNICGVYIEYCKKTVKKSCVKYQDGDYVYIKDIK